MVPGEALILLAGRGAAVDLRRCPSELSALSERSLPLWVACAWQEHPLGDLAGRCDDAMGGVLSRQLASKQLSLQRGESTLVSASCFNGAAVLLQGLGPRGGLTSSQARRLGRLAAERVRSLGHREYALEPAWTPGAAALAAAFMGGHQSRCVELGGMRDVSEVTWILPAAVQVQSPGTGAGLRRRRVTRHRRPRRPIRRVTFFRSPSKK